VSNLQLAEKILQSCAEAGVKEYCLCAGARNSPLVFLLAKAKGIRIHSFFEERSAAFFALGRIKRDRRPVAVVTTSGTAVAELLPAAVEATYAGLPLLLVTADRPRIYRGTGAPQAIDQPGIFSSYVEACWDLEGTHDNLGLKDWSQIKPIHINVCFDEPLIDGEVKILELSPAKPELSRKLAVANPSLVPQKIRRPLIIVGALKNHDIGPVLEFLNSTKAPIFTESISQLRGRPELKHCQIIHSEKAIPQLFGKGHCESVLRIGGIPTLRFWRDLETEYKRVPVFSCSGEEWTGLARSSAHIQGFEYLHRFEIESDGSSLADQSGLDQLQASFQKYPRSEVALLNKLARKIHGRSVYLGNSLPIREWDLVSSFADPAGEVEANRGANGIDGQISTFLGWSEGATEHLGLPEAWACLGDLTAMYDLSALWITPHLKKGRRRLVVVNNQGGQIFKNIFAEPQFLNTHGLQFSDWAKQWGWAYQAWTEIPERVDFAEENIVIELKPDGPSSDQFWQEYKKL
jgi:2-succinyl-5-enolpyruvyl-6-hydroxy-3-cyclohexene-1-carboxylate synthase